MQANKHVNYIRTTKLLLVDSYDSIRQKYVEEISMCFTDMKVFDAMLLAVLATIKISAALFCHLMLP